MYKAFLIKYAEIGVKGKNRDLFEEALVRQIKYALKRCEGEFRVRRTRGRIYIDVLSDDYDYEETIDNLKTVCGVSAICPMVQLEDEGFDKLCESAVSYMDEHYPDKNITFKVNARSPRSCPPPNTMGRIFTRSPTYKNPIPFGPWILCPETDSMSIFIRFGRIFALP